MEVNPKAANSLRVLLFWIGLAQGITIVIA